MSVSARGAAVVCGSVSDYVFLWPPLLVVTSAQRYSLTNPFINRMQITKSITCSLSLTNQNMMTISGLSATSHAIPVAIKDSVQVWQWIRKVFDGYVQIKSYVNSLQSDIFMIFLAAIRAEKSIAEKTVPDSRQQHCLQFVVCSSSATIYYRIYVRL